MIVGSGSIARCLTDREGAIFFASGVSNSRYVPVSEQQREMDLLAKQKRDACLFYFSSMRLNFDYTDAYSRHKAAMEKCVKSWFPSHAILRIGNLIGDINPNTFINYIKNRQAQGLSVEIRNEYKYMIDGATLNMLCQTLPLDQKIELTVATKIAKVKDLL